MTGPTSGARPHAAGTRTDGPASRPDVRPDTRPDASMSLLNSLWAEPLEGDYALATPAQPGNRPARVSRSGVVLLVAGLLGVVLAGAVASLRAPTATLQASRARLVEQITERTAEADALATGNDALSAEIGGLQTAALSTQDPALLARLQRAEVASGAVAVQGPGIVVVLTDATQDPQHPDPESLVQDVDLQIAANGLWAAGAEAIAINGQRLTSLSAIRVVGQAILVNLVPLTSPYTIEAVGDPAVLQVNYARGTAAQHAALLASHYGIGVQLRASQELTLAGAGATTLREASVAGTPGVTSSSPTAKEDQS